MYIKDTIIGLWNESTSREVVVMRERGGEGGYSKQRTNIIHLINLHLASVRESTTEVTSNVVDLNNLAMNWERQVKE